MSNRQSSVPTLFRLCSDFFEHSRNTPEQLLPRVQGFVLTVLTLSDL